MAARQTPPHGIADDNPNAVRWFGIVGVSGFSPLPCRDQDSFGIAYFYLGVSEPLKNLAPVLLPLQDEQGIEVYYNMAVTPWCQITPDLQVISPFHDRVESSLLFGLRAKIDF
jgi:porin